MQSSKEAQGMRFRRQSSRMRKTPEKDALTWQVAFVYSQDQPSQKETELGCSEAAAGFRAGLLWRKEHPELLSGCLRPERNNKGEATRQKEHCLIWSEAVFLPGDKVRGRLAQSSQKGGVPHCPQLSLVLNNAPCWEVGMDSIAPGLWAAWVKSPIFMEIFKPGKGGQRRMV